MKLPTASSLERAVHCPASFALPQIRERGGRAANRGTVIHKFIENCHSMGRDEALSRVPAEFQDVCSRIDINQLMPENCEIRAEVGYAYDFVAGTARCLGFGKGRDYSDLRPTEIGGTLDQELIWPNAVLARDLKTGYGYLAPTATNFQIRFFALCHSKVYPGRQSVGELVKILDNGDFACEPAEFHEDTHWRTHLTIVSMVAQIADAQELVNEGRQPDVAEGEWCKYCPAFEACPGKVGLIQRYLGCNLVVNYENLPAAYKLIRDLENLAKRSLEKVKEFIGDEMLDLGNGMVYGKSPVDQKYRAFRKSGNG